MQPGEYREPNDPLDPSPEEEAGDDYGTDPQGGQLPDQAAIQEIENPGANWFFWIAGLSLVNAVIVLTEGDTRFLIGLAITDWINVQALGVAQQAPEAAMIAKAIGFAASLLVAGVFALFGWLGRKNYLPAFLVGIVLYGLDGLIYAVYDEWMSVGFHLFALFGLFIGLQTARRFKLLQRAALAHSK